MFPGEPGASDEQRRKARSDRELLVCFLVVAGLIAAAFFLWLASVAQVYQDTE